jgi:ComF family protein
MHLLSYIKDLIVDFIFPRNLKILELEALSTGTLIETLPQAERSKNKNMTALFDYKHPIVKEIIWELKYNGNQKIAEKLGEILYDHIHQEIQELTVFESAHWQKDKILLIPMPISDKRRFERGWNQSELLAQAVVKMDKEKIFKYLPRQLIKIKDTESQTKTTSRKERLENVVNSMKILHPPSVAGECIIILDDVTTTGSTFTEAQRVLYDSGAKKILCVAVAN